MWLGGQSLLIAYIRPWVPFPAHKPGTVVHAPSDLHLIGGDRKI